MEQIAESVQIDEQELTMEDLEALDAAHYYAMTQEKNVMRELTTLMSAEDWQLQQELKDRGYLVIKIETDKACTEQS